MGWVVGVVSGLEPASWAFAEVVAKMATARRVREAASFTGNPLGDVLVADLVARELYVKRLVRR